MLLKRLISFPYSFYAIARFVIFVTTYVDTEQFWQATEILTIAYLMGIVSWRHMTNTYNHVILKFVTSCTHRRKSTVGYLDRRRFSFIPAPSSTLLYQKVLPFFGAVFLSVPFLSSLPVDSLKKIKSEKEKSKTKSIEFRNGDLTSGGDTAKHTGYRRYFLESPGIPSLRRIRAKAFVPRDSPLPLLSSEHLRPLHSARWITREIHAPG